MNINQIKNVLENTCKGLCRQEDKVWVTYAELSNIVSYSILVDNSDQAKVIGARGKNIKAIKNIFENIEAESESGKFKTVKVFLDSESPARSKPEKFKSSVEWDSEPYADLAFNLYKLYSNDVEIEFDDIGSLSVFEVKNGRSCPGFISRSIKHLMESIGKCKGGTIDINYVE
tara:strand:+ start:903 stop:1421 length:519 start_codon:yes stop_codon:yes gene_type:complete